MIQSLIQKIKQPDQKANQVIPSKIRKNITKKISQTMIAVMVLGQIMPSASFLRPQQAYAVTNITQANFDIIGSPGMTPGGVGNSSPVNTAGTGSYVDGQLIVNFPMANTPQGFYRLSYYVNPQLRVIVEITRSGNAVDVAYFEYELIGGTWEERPTPWLTWNSASQTWVPLAIHLQQNPTYAADGITPLNPDYRILSGRPTRDGLPTGYTLPGEPPLTIPNPGPLDPGHDPDYAPGEPIPNPPEGQPGHVPGVPIHIYNPNVPFFHIAGASPSPNQNGFSFQSLSINRNMHIRFTGNSFQFASDGFQTATYYEFVLERHNTRADVDALGPGFAHMPNETGILNANRIRRLAIISGAAPDTIRIDPFANVDRTLPLSFPGAPVPDYAGDMQPTPTPTFSINDIETGGVRDFFWRGVDRRALPTPPGAGTWHETDISDNRWPADPNEEQGLIISFDLPLVARTGNPALPIDGHIPVTGAFLNLFSPVPGFDLTAGIHDIFSATPDITADVLGFNNDGERLTVGMVHDEHSSLFLPSSNVFFAPPAAAIQGGLVSHIQRPTLINNPVPHTFLHFMISPAGNFIYVPRPYQQAGTYTLLQSQWLASEPFGAGQPIATHTITTAGPGQPVGSFSFPILPMQDMVYQIVFVPYGQTGRIYSQHIIVSPDPNAVEIGTPRFFQTNAIHRPMPGVIDGSRGQLELNLRWELGDFSDIRTLFSQAAHPIPGTSPTVYRMYVDYALEWSLDLGFEMDDAFRNLAGVRVILESEALPPGVGVPILPGDNIPPMFVMYQFIDIDGNIIDIPYMNSPGDLRPGELGEIPQLQILNPPIDRTVTPTTPEITIDNVLPGGSQFVLDLTILADTFHAEDGTPISDFMFPHIYLLRMNPLRRSNGTPALVGPIGDITSGNWADLDFVGPSELSGITIGEFDELNAPPPQNAVADNPVTQSVFYQGDYYDQVSFDVSWMVNAAAMRNFLEFSYGLMNSVPSYSYIEMTIYITQDESLITGAFLDAVEEDVDNSGIMLEGNDPIPNAATFEFYRHQMYTIVDISGYAELRYGGTPTAPVTINFSDIGDDPVRPGILASGAARNALRAGEIVAIRGITLPQDVWEGMQVGANGANANIYFTLDGLDVNQKYYIIIDLLVRQEGDEIIPPNPVHGTPEIRIWTVMLDASFGSNLIGITTPGYVIPPDARYQTPPAPNPINVTDVDLDSATIYWNRIPELLNLPGALPEGYHERLEYEVVRIRNNQMTPAQMNHTMPLTHQGGDGNVFWDVLVNANGPMHDGITAFRTITSYYAENAAIETFDGTSWTASSVPIVIDETRTTDSTTDAALNAVMSIRDNTLASNTLYYVYVRTIRIITAPDGTETRLYSVFNHATFTTVITEHPANLQALPDAEGHDRETEITIRFLAPLNNLLNLGDTLFIEYRLQADQQDWQTPNRMRVPFLLEAGNNRPVEVEVEGRDRTNWYEFYYHIIGGITPGIIHNVQVRMVQIDGSGAQTFSQWSNIATWMPDTDLAEEEYRRIIRDWENHMREEIYRLLRSPYWVMRQDNQAFAVVLRPSMFNEIMRGAIGNQIVLPFNLAAQTVYYVPAQSFLQAVAAESSWIIPSDRMRITVPHGTIDMANNDAVLAMTRALRDRGGDIEDYFVRMNVHWAIVPQVHGQQTLTQSADVSLSLVATDYNIARWEQETLQELIDAIDNENFFEQHLNYIIEGVRGYADNFELEREVLAAVAGARNAFTSIVRREFTDIQSNRSHLPVNFDRSIMLNATAGDGQAAVEAFTMIGGVWARIATTFDNGAGALVASSAPVVFTGRTINIPGLVGTPGSGQTIGIVARHGLDDFFGTGFIDTTAIATRGQLIDSVARMLGAPRGTTNSNAWLRDRGINIAPGAANTPITSQEAMHMLMQVYESQTGTTAESVRITNFGATANLVGLNPSFATSYRAAIELGLYTNTNLQPAGHVTIGTLLDTLTNLDSLIGL